LAINQFSSVQFSTTMLTNINHPLNDIWYGG
jgi:hypothetical protein